MRACQCHCQLLGELHGFCDCWQRLTRSFAVLCMGGLTAVAATLNSSSTAGLSSFGRKVNRPLQQYDAQLERRAGGLQAQGLSARSSSSTSTGAFLRGLLDEHSPANSREQRAASKPASTSTSAFLRGIFAEHSPSRSDEHEVTSKPPAPEHRGTPPLAGTPSRDAFAPDHANSADAEPSHINHEVILPAQANAQFASGKRGRRVYYDAEESKKRLVESRYRSYLRKKGIPAPYAPGYSHPKKSQSTDPHDRPDRANAVGSQPLQITVDRRRPGRKAGTMIGPSSTYSAEERRQRNVEAKRRSRLRAQGIPVPFAPGYGARANVRKQQHQHDRTVTDSPGHPTEEHPPKPSSTKGKEKAK